MLLFAESIESSHKEITNNKSQSVWEAIPCWSYTQTVYREIEYVHMNTRVIQYILFLFCEVIFFDFCSLPHTMPSNHIYILWKARYSSLFWSACSLSELSSLSRILPSLSGGFFLSTTDGVVMVVRATLVVDILDESILMSGAAQSHLLVYSLAHFGSAMSDGYHFLMELLMQYH